MPLLVLALFDLALSGRELHLFTGDELRGVGLVEEIVVSITDLEYIFFFSEDRLKMDHLLLLPTHDLEA